MPAQIWILILVTVLMSAIGQLALKIAVTRANLKDAIGEGFVAAVAAAATSPYFWGALVIYGVSVALWLWVLSEAELSVAYPFVSLGFVITMAFAVFFLHESVNHWKLIGTLLIVAGCMLVAKSA